jgi:hypothetical protein
MFAGMPGTGIGALFFALVCLVLSIRNRLRGCSVVATVSSIWILGCLVLVYGSGLSIANGGETSVFRPSIIPELLLIFVLTISFLVARFIRSGVSRSSKSEF